MPSLAVDPVWGQPPPSQLIEPSAAMPVWMQSPPEHVTEPVVTTLLWSPVYAFAQNLREKPVTYKLHTHYEDSSTPVAATTSTNSSRSSVVA